MIVLIADDDQLNRFTLKSMLEEILTKEDTILEAWNGKEMIAVCKEKMPDIVFTDIRMPHVNGIDAIAECKKYNLNSIFVIVSGYSDFEVAQRALQLDVKDYLLKPVDEEKLAAVVEKLQTKLGEEKERRNSRFRLELLHAFNDFRVLDEGANYAERRYGADFFYEVISVRSRYFGQEQKAYADFQNEIMQEMEKLGEKLLKRGSYYSHVYSEEGTIFFVFCTQESGREEIHSFVKKLALRMRRPDVAMHFTRFSRNSMRQVYDECRQADICRGIEMNYPEGAFIDLDRTKLPEESMKILGQVNRIMDAWECADAIAYKEIVHQLNRQYQEKNPELNLQALSRYCSRIGLNISGENFQAFCQSLIGSFLVVFADTPKEADVVEQVKAYIERNYQNDIGVAHVAEVFDITPNYLSSIFRQKVGCKFTEYLTNVRVEHAKQLLLRHKTTSINDIAAMAGYSRAGYFTTIFQKVTGLKPSDYRKKYLN